MDTGSIAPHSGSPDLWRDYARRLSVGDTGRKLDNGPDFFIIGPPETGVDSFAETLRRDPRFVLPEASAYFSHLWRQHSLTSYFTQFQVSGAAGCRGEAAHSYFILPEVAIRQIRRELPDLKLIVTLRDPAERAWAHACRAFRSREEWFREVDNRDAAAVPVKDWYGALVHPLARAFQDYAGPLARWLRYFPAEQLLILPVERLAADNDSVQREFYDFLDVDYRPQQSFTDAPTNPEPTLNRPKAIAPLLDAIGAAAISELTNLAETTPPDVSAALHAALSSWRNPPADSAKRKLPTLGDKRPRLEWDALTKENFPPEVLFWAARSAEAPPDRERLVIAALNFDYASRAIDHNAGSARQEPLATPYVPAPVGDGLNGHKIEPSSSQLSALNGSAAHRLLGVRKASPASNGALAVGEDAGPMNGSADKAAVGPGLGNDALRDALKEWGKHLGSMEAALSGSAQMLETILARTGEGTQHASSGGAPRQNDNTAAKAETTALSSDSAVHDAAYRAEIDAALARQDDRAAALEATMARIGGEAARLWATAAAMDARLADRETRIAELEDALSDIGQRLRGAATAAQTAALEAEALHRDERIAALEATASQVATTIETEATSRDERIAALEATASRVATSIETEATSRDERIGTLEATTSQILAAIGTDAMRRDERIAALEAAVAAEVPRLSATLDSRLAQVAEDAKLVATAELAVLQAAGDQRLDKLEATLRSLAEEAPRLWSALGSEFSSRDRRITELQTDFAHVSAAASQAAVAGAAQIAELRAERDKRLGEFAGTLRSVAAEAPRLWSALDLRLAQYAERIAIAEETLTLQDEGLSRISTALEREHQVEQSRLRPVSFPPYLDLLSLLIPKDGVRNVDAGLAISSDAPPGHFLYGPYLSIEPGTYSLGVWYSATNIKKTDQPILTIEIVVDGRPLDSLVIISQSLMNPVRTYFEILDRVPNDQIIEFRFAHHCNAELEINSIRLRPAPPQEPRRRRRFPFRLWKGQDQKEAYT